MDEHPFRRIVRSWFCIYVIWFLWESAIRILVDHSDWEVVQSLQYSGINLLYGAAWSLILAALHSGLLKIRFLKPFLTSQIAIPFAALIAVPVLFAYRNYLTQTQTSMLFRWFSASLILLTLLAAVLALVKLLHYGNREIPGKAFVIMASIPVALICVSPLFRNRTVREAARGPIKYVVFISIDTLRYDYVSAYGGSMARTPVIDQAAAEGVRFENAITPVTFTGPSHITMFTGQSPVIHGVFYNGQPLSGKAVTLTRRLRGAGFRTAAFIAGYPLKRINCGLDRGFQVYDERLSWIDFFSETYYGRILDAIPFVALGILRQAKEVTDPALLWLEKNSDAPFFLFVHYFDPHYPYGHKSDARHIRKSLAVMAKPEDVENQKRLYAQEVESVDSQIGRIINFLKQRGIYDQTFFMITADHGESLGEHGYYYSHGLYLYEQLVRIPMILRCPALTAPGMVVRQQVALMDIYPTILNAAGLSPGAQAGGFDLIRVAHDPKIIADRNVLSHNFIENVHGLRTNGWKLIKNPGEDHYELYDLKEDPGETRNLYKTNPEVSARLKQSLQELLFSPADNERPGPRALTAEQIERLRSLGYLN